MRVRFAPSPTGYLHVGGARTALFNWLLARGAGGTFVLRIEDTDRQRSSEEHTAAILSGLRWLGLDWDEGPLHQADGVERHRADAQSLLDAGLAYRCFCTAEQLEAQRRRAAEAKTSYGYDRTCLAIGMEESARRAEAGEPYTVRFRVPAGETSWDDAVHGHLQFDNRDIEDFIILRTDGTPIYNMAVVSDDIAMAITHVIRGDDHISNTPKQILLYRALGKPEPVFGHVPMILGPDGKRLSKRHGATAIGEYERMGIVPAAMVNFLALLGWSSGTDEEVFTTDELIERFSLDEINLKSAVFDTQKLMWMNGQHLMRLPAAELADRVATELEAAGLPGRTLLAERSDWFVKLVELLKVRSRSIAEIVQQARPYIADEVEYDPAAVAKHWRAGADVADRLRHLRESWSRTEWDEAGLEAALRELADQLGVSAGRLIHPVRVALTGSAAGPGIFEVATQIGRARGLRRIDAAIDRLTRTPA